MKKSKCIFSFFTFIFLFGNVSFSYCTEEHDLNNLVLKLSRTQEDTAKVDILIKLANLTSWSDRQSSEQYAREALELSQEIHYKKGLAYSKYQLARLFQDYEFDLSESLVMESLEYAKEFNDSILIAMVYNVLGNLNFNLDQEEDAFYHYNKSLGIYLRHEKDSLAATIYSNLAVVQDELAGNKGSMDYYLKAIELNKKVNNYLGIAIIYSNMGSNLIEYNKLNEAYDYLQKCLKIIEEHNLVRLYPYLYNNLSSYYEKTGNYEESIKCGKKALLYSRGQSSRFQEMGALIGLKSVYYLMSDLETAYFYSEQINMVKDTINKHNRLKELDLLELRFKFAEEQKAQELKSARIEASYYKKELTYVYLLLGSGLLIITLIFLYIAQRNRTHRKNLEQKTTLLEKEKLKKDLEYKSKELTTNVMYLLKKNEFISEISDKLKKSSFESTERYEDTINRIISELDKSISTDNWEDFEVRFQEVHVGFYNKLSKDFPALTPNELRLCAFLKLNMTSKEIAEITFQSLISLKSARYRLRKKLGLDREENLIAFLIKY